MIKCCGDVHYEEGVWLGGGELPSVCLFFVKRMGFWAEKNIFCGNLPYGDNSRC